MANEDFFIGMVNTPQNAQYDPITKRVPASYRKNTIANLLDYLLDSRKDSQNPDGLTNLEQQVARQISDIRKAAGSSSVTALDILARHPTQGRFAVNESDLCESCIFGFEEDVRGARTQYKGLDLLVGRNDAGGKIGSFAEFLEQFNSMQPNSRSIAFFLANQVQPAYNRLQGHRRTVERLSLEGQDLHFVSRPLAPYVIYKSDTHEYYSFPGVKVGVRLRQGRNGIVLIDSLPVVKGRYKHPFVFDRNPDFNAICSGKARVSFPDSLAERVAMLVFEGERILQRAYSPNIIPVTRLDIFHFPENLVSKRQSLTGYRRIHSSI